MTIEKVAFVGGGNMTRAIVGGMLQHSYHSGDILIAEPFAEQRDILAKELPGVRISADNDEIVRRAANVVLSVKPQILATVCRGNDLPSFLDEGRESNEMILAILVSEAGIRHQVCRDTAVLVAAGGMLPGLQETFDEWDLGVGTEGAHYESLCGISSGG